MTGEFQLTDAECIEGLERGLEGEINYQNEIIFGSEAPFRVMINHLCSKNFEYKPPTNYNRLIIGIAYCFLPKEADRKCAIGMTYSCTQRN